MRQLSPEQYLFLRYYQLFLFSRILWLRKIALENAQNRAEDTESYKDPTGHCAGKLGYENCPMPSLGGGKPETTSAAKPNQTSAGGFSGFQSAGVASNAALEHSKIPDQLRYIPKTKGYKDAKGVFYENKGGTITIQDYTDKPANPNFWDDKVFKQHHGGEEYKADISAKDGAYGSKKPFKIKEISVREGYGGTMVINSTGNPEDDIKLVHFTNISRKAYQAYKSGGELPGGTFLGEGKYAIGYTSGPHFHVARDKNEQEYSNEENLNLLRGKSK